MKNQTHGISPKDNDSQPQTQNNLLRIKTSLRVAEGLVRGMWRKMMACSLQQTRNAPQPPEAASKEQLSI